MDYRNIVKSLTSLFYRLKYKSIDAHNSMLYHLKVTGGGNNTIFVIKDAHISRVKIHYKGANNVIRIIGCGLYHESSIAITGNDNLIEIEDGCALSNLCVTIKGNGCSVKVGSKTTSNGTSIYCVGEKNEVTIGNDCMFAADTEIWSSDSHKIVDEDSKQTINRKKVKVSIGNHVWIAEHAKILKGVQVADNCILGMGCILTKDTEPNSIFAGVPARNIKNNINWKR